MFVHVTSPFLSFDNLYNLQCHVAEILRSLDEDEWEDLSGQRGILRVLDGDELEHFSIILSRKTKQVAIR